MRAQHAQGGTRWLPGHVRRNQRAGEWEGKGWEEPVTVNELSLACLLRRSKKCITKFAGGVIYMYICRYCTAKSETAAWRIEEERCSSTGGLGDVLEVGEDCS